MHSHHARRYREISSEHTGEYRSQNTTYTMNAKSIESVIILKFFLHHSNHKEADYGGVTRVRVRTNSVNT